MKKWQTTLHGGMMIVMLGNSLPAYAQQAVRIPNGNDVALGSVGDSACGSAGAVSCTLNAISRLIASAVLGAIGTGTNPIGSVQPTTAANWGIGAIASPPPANAPYLSGLANSTEPAKATTGNQVGGWFDLAGKPIVSPYAARELMVRGMASTSSTLSVSLIGPQGSNVKTYITDIQCGRTDAGTTALAVTFNDNANTVMVLPNNGGGGGNNISPKIPLVTAANATFTFSSSISVGTLICNAQGFSGY
jgi:hypothetical protein